MQDAADAFIQRNVQSDIWTIPVTAISPLASSVWTGMVLSAVAPRDPASSVLMLH